jgi:hypothetical protein
MTKIIVDSTLRDKLSAIKDAVELCDEEGRTLGRFLPSGHDRDLLSGASFPIPFSDEEIARRRQEKGGRSLAEIWKSLGRT